MGGIVPFDYVQASLAAMLDGPTRGLDLSWGDRACLALGQNCSALVLTANPAWAKLDIGIKIEVIRSDPS